MTEFLRKNRGNEIPKFPQCDVLGAWKNEKFTLTEKMFRQSNQVFCSCVINFSKTVAFTKFLSKLYESEYVKLRNLHTFVFYLTGIPSLSHDMQSLSSEKEHRIGQYELIISA